MRCIVIDDEKPGLDLVCNYLNEIPFVQTAGVFQDMAEALNFLMSGHVDLIFTDIELNANINGIEFIKSLPSPPMVIFISAYDQYAIDGFSLDAVDYLLKPVSKERFFKAVNKAYRTFLMKTSPKTAAEPEPEQTPAARQPEYIFVKVENRLLKVFLSDILYVKGFGDYVKLYLTGGKTLLSLMTLNSLEAVLPCTFSRIHRSYITAMDKIDEIEHKRIRIGDALLPIGESYMKSFFGKI